MPTIASGAIRKLVDVARRMGADTDALFAATGIDPRVTGDRDARVQIAELHALWNAFLRDVPRARTAVFEAMPYVPGDYGLVGFVVMNSATLGEALTHMVRYIGLWTDDPALELQDCAVVVSYRARFADSEGLRVATESAHFEILGGARLTTQRAITPIVVRFAHHGPSNASTHEKFFGCPVLFDQKDTAMVFRSEDLALPLPKADPQLGAFLREMANQALSARVVGEPSVLDKIRAIVAEELQKGLPPLEVVAQRLAMSDRTLRRRLEENGTSFRAVLDDTRADLARKYVRDKRLPLSEVAFMLGFSEPSTFHRAFKRWTKTTPSLWRARE